METWQRDLKGDGIVRIAIVGDIHGQWDGVDRAILEGGDIDLVLFVGDFGNEAIDVVREIAKLKVPMAANFGNHDAWYSATSWGRERCPYDRTTQDWVKEQMDLLGDRYVGYGYRDFPALGLSVVGGKPFSWGGSQWSNSSFYRDRFSVESMEESRDRIVAAGMAAGFDRLLIVAHNGPTGLGDTPESICGKDWQPLGGDYGDPDLAAAIEILRNNGKRIDLVAFGHMHYQLRHRHDRLRERSIRDDLDTVYFNAACCPRHQISGGMKQRHFSLATLTDTGVAEVRSLWFAEDNTVTVEGVNR